MSKIYFARKYAQVNRDVDFDKYDELTEFVVDLGKEKEGRSVRITGQVEGNHVELIFSCKFVEEESDEAEARFNIKAFYVGGDEQKTFGGADLSVAEISDIVMLAFI